MRILIAGASGTIGTALTRALSAEHSVRRLVRRPPKDQNEIFWDPSSGHLDDAVLEDTNAVINLSGAGIAGGLWTRSYKEVLYASRILPTRTLVAAMHRSERPPSVFISQSASGFYGSRGDEVVTESSASGTMLLSDICRRWEAEAHRAPGSVRTITARTGVVMATQGGALPNLLVPIRAFVGGPLGDGNQWWPWISLEDEVRALTHLLTAPIEGPVNLCAPQPARLSEIVGELAGALHRPARVRVPARILHSVMGQLADELLLASTRMQPSVLMESGFTFNQATLDVLGGWVRRELGRS